MREKVTVESAREHLPGDLFVPDEHGSQSFPAIVLCHATGSRRAADFQMARWLCDRGYAVLTFDWHGCVGEPSPRSVMPEQVADDLRAGVTYLLGRPEVDPARIGMFGRGLGGGFVLLAAAADTRVAATVCYSGFGDFARRTALHLGVDAWDRIRAQIADEQSTVNAAVLLGVHAPGAVSADAPPLPNSFEFTAASVRALFDCRPEDVAARIAPRPLLIVHPTADAMFPRAEAISIYAKSAEHTELSFVETSDHMEMYPGRNDRVYNDAMTRCEAFFRRQLGHAVGSAR
jgi:dienelactone hydrolase